MSRSYKLFQHIVFYLHFHLFLFDMFYIIQYLLLLY